MTRTAGLAVFETSVPAGSVRRESRDGVEYLVAPAVVLVEGVLRNELVLADEFGAFVDAWNDVPAPVWHPTDDDENPVSARKLEVQEDWVIGRFYHAEVAGGKLRGEFWLDVGRAEEMGGDAAEVIRLLEAGEPVEVSTGYFRDVEKVAGTWNETPYKRIARNIRPDHVALLPHGLGECSWADGCGAPRVNQRMEDTVAVFVRKTARTPAYDGVESAAWGDVSKTFEAFRDGYYKHSGVEKPEEAPGSVGDAPGAMKRWIASKSLLGDAGASEFRDLCFFPVVNPSTNKLNAGALRAVLGGRGAGADIPETALDSARSKARGLLEREFQAKIEVNGMKGNKTLVVLELSLDEALRRIYRAWDKQVRDKMAPSDVWYSVLEVFQDRVIVTGSDGRYWLYPYSEGDGEIVFGEAIEAEKTYEPRAGGAGMATNSGGVTVEREELIRNLVVNCRCGRSEDELRRMTTEELQALAASAAQPAQGDDGSGEGQSQPAVNDAGDDAGQEIVGQVTAQGGEFDGATMEMLGMLRSVFGGMDAESLRSALTGLVQNSQQERDGLVQEIVANSAGQFQTNDLSGMSLEMLRKMRNAVAPQVNTGRAAGRSVMTNAALEPRVLTMPSMWD